MSHESSDREIFSNVDYCYLSSTRYGAPMRYAAPGTVRSDDRPPVATDNAPSPGAAGRIPAQTRWMVAPRLWPHPPVHGVDPTHPYVRAYWTAVVGASAVADLLRLIAAARRQASIPHPLFLPVLTREGLVHHAGGSIWVHAAVPALGISQVARLSPRLRRSHPVDLRKALLASR